MSIWGNVKEVARAKMALRSCDKVGARPRLNGGVVVNNDGHMEIGDRLRLRGSHVPIELGSLPGGKLVIGDNCFINSGTSICAAELITLGNNCLIGNYTIIMDTDFHDLYDRTKPGLTAPVTLEDDVWLACRVTVLKGVTIGKGSAVAAGSVVVKDVPPHTLVGGVPAKVIKSLRPIEERSVAAGPILPKENAAL